MPKNNRPILANSLMRGLLALECFSPEKARLSLAQLAAMLDVPVDQVGQRLDALDLLYRPA